MPPTPSFPRRCLNGLLITLGALLLLDPAFQQITQLPQDKGLSGIRIRTTEFPRWTAKTWRRAQFAADADAWIREHMGMRGWLVFLNRQIRYSLFGQVEPAPLRKRALVIGKGNQLYENIVVIDALRPPQIPPDTMDDFAARLARTRELLKEQNLAFLVILAPNKAIVYPDALPGWARKRISDSRSDYRPFIEALQRHHVPHLDTLALFRKLGPEYPELIAPHAMHWNHHGAWIAWQEAVPLINQQDLLPEIPVPATEDLVMDKPSNMNDELRGQLNLFFARQSQPVPSAYPVAVPLSADTAPMLDVLIVGDSFGMTLMDALARSRLCRRIHLWFYMRNGKAAAPASFDSRESRGLPGIEGLELISGVEENGRRMLADKNLVILVVTTFNIDKFSWGFDHLVNRLYGDPNDNPPLPEEIQVDLDD